MSLETKHFYCQIRNGDFYVFVTRIQQFGEGKSNLHAGTAAASIQLKMILIFLFPSKEPVGDRQNTNIDETEQSEKQLAQRVVSKLIEREIHQIGGGVLALFCLAETAPFVSS